MRISHRGIGSSLAVAATSAIAGGALLPMPAFGQAVEDRSLNDVSVKNVGACSTLTVTFNIRVQLLSYFPSEPGQELHIRVRPLDPGSASTMRESLRPPTSVPALRSITYEGDNPAGPVLSLFFTHDMRFQIDAGEDPHELVIRIAPPGDGPLCAPAEAPSALPPLSGTVQAIPAGLYVINLFSRTGSLGEITADQKAALAGHIAYETTAEGPAEEWHRLREGFFQSRAEAEAERQKLLDLFPDAFVVKVSADERAQGIASRTNAGGPVTAAPPAPKATDADIAETAKLVGEAEQAIKGGNNERAVQLLTNAAALPDNASSPRAHELLGLTRERMGQKAQAQAEYEEYLRRYPSGEAAARVRQRLAAITGVGTGGALRAASPGRGSATAWSWNARGSFSQFYYRDQSTTTFIDASVPDPNAQANAIDNVNLNMLMTSADLTVTGGNDRRQLQLRAAGAYSKDFRQGGQDIKSITALYLDYTDSTTGTDLRIGRQTRNSAGVLGRFDGGLLSWQAKRKLRFTVVAGLPVLTSRQTYLLKKRYFYGASLDIGARRSPVQATVYWFDQRARGGFIDRQAVGFEGRVLLKNFNAYTIIDYDVHYKQLNLGLLTLNYTFPDTSNLSVTADYRQSPLLTTYNALIGQVYSGSFLPVTDLRGLRPFFTDAQIYQLAADRTLVTKSVTVSYSRPLTKKLQTNFDFTVTNTGGTPGTPASSGTEAVIALPAVGTEYYYGAQLIGSGMFWQNDIYILSGRYSNTQSSHSWTADFTARIPVSSKFRLSPRVRYGQRNGKITPTTPVPGSYSQFQPTLRLNYYPMRHSEVEIEFGGNFSTQHDNFGGVPTTTRESGFVISAGYRLDF